MHFHIARVLPAALLMLPSVGLAHGTNLEWAERNGVEVKACFDNGQPLQAAEVTVFSPADPSAPWAEAITDSTGRYFFVPDTAGTWDVRVRKGGHGGMVHIRVDSTLSAPIPEGGSTRYSTIQTVIMAACVIWGFVGTAFFFRRRAG